MTVEELNRLKRAAEDAREVAANEEEENKKEVINYFENINSIANPGIKIRVRPNLDSARREYHHYTDIEFLNDKGESAFGADISLSVRRNYSFSKGDYEAPQFKMGCSTMGQVSREEAPYQVHRCYLMAELWKRVDEIITLFSSLKNEAAQKAREAERAYDRASSELEREKREKITKEITNNLVSGYEFNEEFDTKDKNTVYVDLKVERLTAKRCYLSGTTKRRLNSYEMYDIEDEETKANTYVKRQFSGYIETEYLIETLVAKEMYPEYIKNYVVYDRLSGKNVSSRDYVTGTINQ